MPSATSSRVRDPFTQCHPAVNFVFYALVLGVSMACLHPYVLGISFLSALAYGVALRGWRHMGRLLAVFIVPGMIIVALLNPTFNHNGVTLLYTMGNGNSITLESIVFGVALAATLAVATLWFVSLNAVLTRDKFVYAVGRIFPTGALILSMSFRFIPLFARQFRATAVGQKYMGSQSAPKASSLIAKLRSALSVTSALFSWSMENAIHVSDSMQARAYGRHRRTSYTSYRWDRRNVGIVVGLVVLAGITIFAISSGGLAAQYDPSLAISGITAAPSTIWTWIGLVSFTLAANFPLGMRLYDAGAWKRYVRSLGGAPVHRDVAFATIGEAGMGPAGKGK